MIVIGVDTHKYSHALAAVDEGTGRVLGSREISADDRGYLVAVRWAQGLDRDRVWALEDCRHVSHGLEQVLLAAGERVVRVAPHRMGASRRGERRPGKSDEIDSLAIARAVVKDGIEKFPVAYLDERSMEVRLLCDHRKDLVAERTRLVNRLRWRLVVICPELERSIPPRKLHRLRELERVDRRLRRMPASIAIRIARAELAHVRRLTREADELERELRQLIKAQRPWLLEERGCNALTAAVLIGHTAGAERFRSEACFGRQAGTSPIPCSSGRRNQQRLNRGGDRQLNSALHIIAVTRAHYDSTTKAYLERKQAEGKTKRGALRSLKRALARRFYRLLAQPPLPAHQGHEPPGPKPLPPRPEVQRTGAAPNPMICTT
jgi:transposase